MTQADITILLVQAVPLLLFAGAFVIGLLLAHKDNKEIKNVPNN